MSKRNNYSGRRSEYKISDLILEIANLCIVIYAVIRTDVEIPNLSMCLAEIDTEPVGLHSTDLNKCFEK